MEGIHTNQRRFLRVNQKPASIEAGFCIWQLLMNSSPLQPIQISYRCSFWSFYRGQVRIMVSPRVLFWFALIGVVISPAFFFPLDKWSIPLMEKLLLAWIGGCLAFWLNILFAITIVSFVAPFKIKTVVTSCDLDALRERSTTYNKQMSWSKIAQIFSSGGDVHFLSQSGMQGLYVPREAFSSRQEAEAFCENARRIWQNALSQQAT